MKKRLLASFLSLFALSLAWCGSKCECDNENAVDEDAALNEATQNCLDKWWTHSLIHSQTAVYGECAFPSWVTCEDRELAEWKCQYEVDLSNIDTEIKRIKGCEEAAINYIKDVEDGEIISIDWRAESEGGASFVRDWVVKYSKWWDNRKINIECVADFVDWSISVSEASYDQPDVDEFVEEDIEDDIEDEEDIEDETEE